MQFKHISLLFSLSCMFLLYFISTLTQPVYIDIYEIQNYENKVVTTQGLVKEYYNTKYGNLIICLTDNSSSITIFSEENFDLEFGDKIQVTGKVQKYEDEWEIVVDSNRNICLITKWANLSVPIWQVAQNPDKYENLNINVTGIVDLVNDDYFFLKDIEKNHTVMAISNINVKKFIGQQVWAKGRLEYYNEQLMYRFYVSQDVNSLELIPIGSEYD
ncbi:MAG: hypothetical protein JXA91_05040 [Candidatus Thermoplasmatota archaeon]|nr:hypothetical protein [Candidatus Thermoplasmatota archaeon]